MRNFIFVLFFLMTLAVVTFVMAKQLNQVCLALDSFDHADGDSGDRAVVRCRDNSSSGSCYSYRADMEDDDDEDDDDDVRSSLIVCRPRDSPPGRPPTVHTWTDHKVSTKPFSGAAIVSHDHAHVQSLRVWLPRNITATEVFTFTLFLHRRGDAPVRISPVLTWDASIDGNNVLFGLGANSKLRKDDVISVSRTHKDIQRPERDTEPVVVAPLTNLDGIMMQLTIV